MVHCVYVMCWVYEDLDLYNPYLLVVGLPVYVLYTHCFILYLLVVGLPVYVLYTHCFILYLLVVGLPVYVLYTHCFILYTNIKLVACLLGIVCVRDSAGCRPTSLRIVHSLFHIVSAGCRPTSLGIVHSLFHIVYKH